MSPMIFPVNGLGAKLPSLVKSASVTILNDGASVCMNLCTVLISTSIMLTGPNVPSPACISWSVSFDMLAVKACIFAAKVLGNTLLTIADNAIAAANVLVTRLVEAAENELEAVMFLLVLFDCVAENPIEAKKFITLDLLARTLAVNVFSLEATALFICLAVEPANLNVAVSNAVVPFVVIAEKALEADIPFCVCFVELEENVASEARKAINLTFVVLIKPLNLAWLAASNLLTCLEVVAEKDEDAVSN